MPFLPASSTSFPMAKWVVFQGLPRGDSEHSSSPQGQDGARHQLGLSWLHRAALLPKNTTSGHLLCLLATPHRAAVLSCLSEMPQHDFCPKPTPLPTATQDHSTPPVTDPDSLFSLTDPPNPQLPPPSHCLIFSTGPSPLFSAN